MTTSVDIRSTKAWLDEHIKYVSTQVRQGYDANAQALEVYAAQVHRMESLLTSAHEFLTGEWEPDDLDRRKFVRDLADVLGLDDEDDDDVECECGRLANECATADDDTADHGDR